MQQDSFYELVLKVIENLPAEFRDRLENVDVVVEDWPSRYQLKKTKVGSRFGLLGLYEGIPHTRRDRGYNMVIPDKITIFQKPIEAKCHHNEEEVSKEIERVVRHEIAHHFGIGDRRLREIESRKQDD